MSPNPYHPPGVDIQLYLKGGIWHAQFYGPGGEESRRLFGTDLIPTAYTSATPAAAVLARIQSLNPGLVVVAS